MVKQKTKFCPFCKCEQGIFKFHEDKSVGMACPNCGTFGPLVQINLEMSEESMEDLAVKEWNIRSKRKLVDFSVK